ncbi:MobA/MobL family [butyrate-producing bacterium SS3/4]|nr:MobA/MobL family [butyrate-producing bacterium SS3/4]
MPCPHNQISIVQRSNRQSAVAAAAYQSGEKLFCEYDQEIKHYPEKRGIVHNEIMLPANAPQEYADRNTLWNAAEAVEKQWNSQLARRWVLTIPREIPPDQYAVLVREFCQQQFVSKGMIVDFAIHDPYPPGHNPHAHVLLTMRAMDEHGKWLPKSRKVYDLDENGERIKLPVQALPGSNGSKYRLRSVHRRRHHVRSKLVCFFRKNKQLLIFVL